MKTARDIAVSHWFPEQLIATAASRTLPLEPQPADIDLRVVPDVLALDPGAVGWLSALLEHSVESASEMRALLIRTRGLQADLVLRTRALHRGIALPHDLRWSGPRERVGSQLLKLLDTHRRVLATNGDAARELRFRIRLQTMDLEASIASYAATELVDPKIMDSITSLDVLCHANYDMDADVIRRLGLARAYHDEVENSLIDYGYSDDALWPLALAAWQEQMAYARVVAKQWAENVVSTARNDKAGWRIRG